MSLNLEDSKKVEVLINEDDISLNSDKDSSNIFYHEEKLSNSLKPRHVSMIALVSIFGTGIFLSSGSTLSTTGPIGMLLCFIFVGIVVGMNQICITETICLMPSTSALVAHSDFFFDEAWGFVMGWIGVYGSIFPIELSATAVVMTYWTDKNPAIFITAFSVVVILVNCYNVAWFGEAEFWFGMLKLLLVAALVLSGLILDLGGVQGQERLGFRYWIEPGPFAEYYATGNLGRFIGFWKAISTVVYSFGGVQTMFIIFAGETLYPRRTAYRASKRIFFRAFIMYLSLVFVLSLIIPYNEPLIVSSTGNAEGSPFVIAMTKAGVHVFPHIINGVVLTSALSAQNNAIGEGSRYLYALAAKGQAPKIFLKVNRNKLPYVATIAIGVFLPLAYMSVSLGAAKVFGWFTSLTLAYLLIKWITIAVNHILLSRAMKKQGYSRDLLPYKFKIAGFASWFSLFWSVIFLLTGGFANFLHGNFEISSFISAYLVIPISLTLYFGYKFIMKTKIKDPNEIKLKQLFQHVEDNPEPPFAKKKPLDYITAIWD